MSPTADATALGFSPTQGQALCALRERYRQDRDLFSDQEQARLLFLRWLFRSNRGLS